MKSVPLGCVIERVQDGLTGDIRPRIVALWPMSWWQRIVWRMAGRTQRRQHRTYTLSELQALNYALDADDRILPALFSDTGHISTDANGHRAVRLTLTPVAQTIDCARSQLGTVEDI